jgi:hypothetical protein
LTGNDQVKDGQGNLELNQDLKWMTDFEGCFSGHGRKDRSHCPEARWIRQLFVAGIRFKSARMKAGSTGTTAYRSFLQQSGFSLLRQGPQQYGEHTAGYSMDR